MRVQALVVLTFCGYVVGIGAQDRPPVQSLLDRLGEPRLDLGVVSSLANYQDDRVLPSLKDAFEARQSKEDRQYIAKSIVRLGEKDEKYYRYLESFAKEAIESDIPDPYVYGADGAEVRGKLSPQFNVWAEKRGISVAEAHYRATNTYPTDVMRFGGTRDHRNLSLLRQGLKSLNLMVVAASADALALMNDVDSIPVILRMIETTNKPIAMLLIGSLSLYDGGVDREQQIRGLLLDPKLREMYRWSMETKHKGEAK
jgi:hypothetical protein